MDNTTLQAMTSSANEHWNTPNEVIDLIKQRYFIALDPCSNSKSTVGAKVAWCGPDIDKDGLAESWQCGGLVFVNPPYGRKIRKWVDKCAEEANTAFTQKNNTEIMLLGPARTDTAFFQKVVCPTADKVLLWQGRLTFAGANAPALFPSFLAYWGHRPDVFMMTFLGKGWFM